MSEQQQEWSVRRWTQEEIALLKQCEVMDPSERTKRCRHGDETTDLQEFAELTGRSIKSVQRKWDTTMRAPAREASPAGEPHEHFEHEVQHDDGAHAACPKMYPFSHSAS